MKTADIYIPDTVICPAQIVGVWEKCYSFSLNLGGKSNCSVREYFIFSSDGTGEYGYSDNSGFAGSSQAFGYRIEGNRLILTTKGEDDTLEFDVHGDHLLYLRDDTFNYAEEFVREGALVDKKRGDDLCF